ALCSFRCCFRYRPVRYYFRSQIVRIRSVLMGVASAGALSCGAVTWAHGLPLQPDSAAPHAHVEMQKQPESLLFNNVRIFDGISAQLSEPSSVLVRNGIIEKVVAGTISPEGARVIGGGGRTLMPGLI